MVELQTVAVLQTVGYIFVEDLKIATVCRIKAAGFRNMLRNDERYLVYDLENFMFHP